MPNGADKKLNFVAKVWDEVAKDYRPIYIAPDATDSVQGDVKLSDATSSTLNASSGMTAATPVAVKAVQDNANNKLDKTTGSNQTVASQVTFQNKITFQKGISIPTGQVIEGTLQGNASTASALQTARTISVKSGSATAGSASFNGSSNVTINLPQLDATTLTGMIPIASVPQAALERLVKVANQSARYALTTSTVQLGDSVLQTDTGVMYIVIDTSNLANANGYQEYKAGTAASVPWSGVTGKPSTFTPSAHNHPFTDITGTIAVGQIADSSITNAKVNFNYAGSSSKGGAATSANKLNGVVLTNQNLNDYHTGVNFYYAAGGNSCTNKPSGIDNFGMFVFQSAGGWWTQILYGSNTTLYSRYWNGTSWSAWKTVGDVADGSITTAKLADNAVTTAKLSNSSVTSAKIVDGTIVAGDIANSTITGSKIASSTITATNIAAGAVGTSQLAAESVTNAKLAKNAVEGENILDGTIYGRKIHDLSITGDHLAAQTIDNRVLAMPCIELSNMSENSVGTSQLITNSVSSEKIQDGAVTLSKLGSDVGTVVVQSAEPTDSHVKLWVKI